MTAQAQGIPLFAVETVRALIDRDIVQPIEGVYRLTGDVGELAVPDSLHALLAARLDALDPEVRRLVGDAAVLGTTFPADALIAIAGKDEPSGAGRLAELVRREVLTVSADPLSPEKGSYGFAQNMLRQVAYDTLSRRDRKARHLAVAAHLRAVFPGDGEEVTDVIARHYLDALEPCPPTPMPQKSAARRSRRWRGRPAGRPGRGPGAGRRQLRRRRQLTGRYHGGQPPPPLVGARRRGCLTNADWATAVGQAGHAGIYRRCGDTRRPPAPRRSPDGRCAGGGGTARRASS